MPVTALQLHEADNVVTTLSVAKIGETVQADAHSIVCRTDIPKGHKVAIAPIADGAAIIKYNQIIGFAGVPIAVGDHVHTHNTTFQNFERDYAFGTESRPTNFAPVDQRPTFDGYRRANGRAGTRNSIAVICTVNCSTTAARYIADHFRGNALDDFANVDAVFPVVHDQGCGVSDHLTRSLIGYALNPNVVGFILIGLGCEGTQASRVMQTMGIEPGPMARTLVIQETGGTAKTVAAGIGMVKEMLPLANACVREPISVSELILGLECGGSDAYSGITANPALGAAVDRLVRFGGTAVLAETPEIFGAEHLLTRRAAKPEIGEQLVAMIRWWERYAAQHGIELNNNPSPGNKKGGLTTILEKSLGAAAKGGTTDLMAVYDYAAPITDKGFTFMNTPGYDPASVTGMVAGGANMVAFTTGRGSVFGGKPVPSLKLATNSEMYFRMQDDMDVNCGVIVDGTASVDEVGRQIFDLIIETASGRPSKSEALGIGDSEFAPWDIGGVL